MQCFRRFGGDCKDVLRPFLLDLSRFDGGGLLQYDMGIRSTKTERTDRREPRVSWSHPGSQLCRYFHRYLVPQDMWVAAANRPMRRDHSMLQGKRHFDETRHTGGRF